MLRYGLDIWCRKVALDYFVKHAAETGGGVQWVQYVEALVATADFHKYANMLRMVIAPAPNGGSTSGNARGGVRLLTPCV